MEKNDSKYVPKVNKIQTLLVRLELEMKKCFQYPSAFKSRQWIERLHQAQELLSLCFAELCSCLSLCNLENLADVFRLSYHVQKTHINYMLEGYSRGISRWQKNPFNFNKERFEESYRKFHEDVTIRKKSKEELLTVNLFDFQVEEKARLIQEAVEKAEEERKKKELEIKLLEEIEQNERIEALEAKNSLGVALSPLSIIDQGTNVIKKLVEAIDDNSKTLENFLNGRRDIPPDKIESLGNQLKEILENNEEKESEESDIDEENEVFVENVKNNEQFGKLLKIFDQKQKDLVVRALVYYRNMKFGVKIDKGIGPDLRIFDLDEVVREKERCHRVIDELELEIKEKNKTIHSLKLSLQGKTDALDRSITKNKTLENDLADHKVQLESFKKELSSKNNLFYIQAEKVVKLQEQENLARTLRQELKKAEEKLEDRNKALASLKEVVKSGEYSERKRGATISFNRPHVESQNKNNLRQTIIKEDVENSVEFLEEERGRSKSLAPWNILDSRKSRLQGTPLGQEQISPHDSKVFITDKKDFSKGTLSIMNKEKSPNLLSERESLHLTSERKIATSNEKKKKLPIPKAPRRLQFTENILNQIRQELTEEGLIQEISREKGYKEDTGRNVLDLFFKDEYLSRKILPVRTMSLADFQLQSERETQKPTATLPKLMTNPKLRRDNSVKRVIRRENTEENRQTPHQQQRINISNLNDLNNLPAEKERSHLILVEKSSSSVYKPLARGISNTTSSENLMQETLIERMKIERSSSVTKSVNLDLDARRLSETDQYKSLDSARSKKTKNVTIASTNHIQEDIEEEEEPTLINMKESTGKVSRTNKEKLKDLYENSMNSPKSRQTAFSEIINAKSKDDFRLINDKEAEILFAFMKSNGENAGSKATLLRKMLEGNKGNDEEDILIEMEAQLKDLQILKSIEAFKAAMKEWSKDHMECGKGCRHLKEFYRQIKYTKQTLKRTKSSEKPPIRIPLTIIGKPVS